MRPVLTAALLCLLAAPLTAQAGAPTGLIEGSVRDSAHSRALAGALVNATRLGGEPLVLADTTDAEGRFRFQGVAAGRYALSFASAFLDSLQFGMPAAEVTVTAGRTTRAVLGVPSGATLRAAACPGVRFEPGMGVLLGTASDADREQPLAAAQVLVGWQVTSFDSVAKRFGTQENLVRVSTDAAGGFQLCGVPANQWLVIQLQHQGHAGPALRASIGDSAGVLIRNLSISAESVQPLAAERAPGDTSAPELLTGSAALTGLVRGQGGQPVAGAQVRVVNTAPTATTDPSGHFSLAALPAGTHELEVRSLGYVVERVSVELRRGRSARAEVQLERVVSLDSVMVIARRVRYPEFEQNRKYNIMGRMLDEGEIEKRRVQTLMDIIHTVNGFRVVYTPQPTVVSGRGKIGLAGNCPSNIVIDKVRGQQIYELPPSLVGAMEFYPDGVGAPEQYRSPCGTIIIWTKR